MVGTLGYAKSDTASGDLCDRHPRDADNMLMIKFLLTASGPEESFSQPSRRLLLESTSWLDVPITKGESQVRIVPRMLGTMTSMLLALHINSKKNTSIARHLEHLEHSML